MNTPPSDEPPSAPAPTPTPTTPVPAPVQALLAAYGSLSVRALLAPLADEGFAHRVLPASLGLPARDKAGFGAHAAAVFGLFAAFAMEPQAVHADAAAGVVVVHALMRGTLWQADAEPWRNECVLLLRLTPDRARIAAIDEFVDSAKALEMRRRHAPREFAAAAAGSSSSSCSSSSSSLASSVLAACGLSPAPDIVPLVVSGAAQVLAVCLAYQALTRSYTWFLRSEA